MMISDMINVEISKYVDPNKLNKFLCKVNFIYEDNRFLHFVTKERAEKYLHYHMKKSLIKILFNKNPYVINIVSFKDNHNRKDLKPFFNSAVFEFPSNIERDLFCESLEIGLQQYFKHALKLYEKNYV